MLQCCADQGSGSALIWVAGSGSAFKLRIRMRIKRVKMTHKNRKKCRIFMFWSAGCSLLRAESFSCSLGVLYGGLGISKLQFLIKKIKIKFAAVYKSPTDVEVETEAAVSFLIIFLLQIFGTVRVSLRCSWRVILPRHNTHGYLLRWALRPARRGSRRVCRPPTRSPPFRSTPARSNSSPEMEVTGIILAKVSRLCQLSCHSRGFLSKL